MVVLDIAAEAAAGFLERLLGGQPEIPFGETLHPLGRGQFAAACRGAALFSSGSVLL